MIYTTHSADETIALGEKIGRKLSKGDVIAFKGDLGAGKTTITRGISIGLGLGDNVTSPTFSLVNEYRGKDKSLIHFDMYRISNSDDIELTGFWDYIEEGCILAVEWSENISDVIPQNSIIISFKRTGDNTREIEILGDERFDDTWN